MSELGLWLDSVFPALPLHLKAIMFFYGLPQALVSVVEVAFARWL